MYVTLLARQPKCIPTCNRNVNEFCHVIVDTSIERILSFLTQQLNSSLRIPLKGLKKIIWAFCELCKICYKFKSQVNFQHS